LQHYCLAMQTPQVEPNHTFTLQMVPIGVLFRDTKLVPRQVALLSIWVQIIVNTSIMISQQITSDLNIQIRMMFKSSGLVILPKLNFLKVQINFFLILVCQFLEHVPMNGTVHNSISTLAQSILLMGRDMI